MIHGSMRAMYGKKRNPRKITASYLQNAALYYLQRFSSSSENLRRVLNRKVERSARFHGTDPDPGSDLVGALIERFQGNGLLDDGAYATGRVASLRRRGDSSRAIRAKVAEKGVPRDLIDAALEAHGENHLDAELTAAVAMARRRGLGPFRLVSRQDLRAKDLAALGRAGFAYNTALTVIDAATADDLEAD